MKKVFSAFFLCIFFLFLLFCPKSALTAAGSGLTLWLDTLVPTLFPVMILSNLLIKTGLSSYIARPFYPFLKRIFGISLPGSYGLLGGFLCGFPMGAKILADLYVNDEISEKEGQILCLFCNNASPVFIISYLINGHLPQDSNGFPVFLILYGAPLLYGWIMCLHSHLRQEKKQENNLYSSNKASFTAPNLAMTDACISNAIQSITKLGGYILLFSVCTEMIVNIFSGFPLLCTFFASFMEMTTGIQQIVSLNCAHSHICILLCGCTAFGGLCTAAQSHEMLHTLHLSIKRYLCARLIIAMFASFFACCYFLK